MTVDAITGVQQTVNQQAARSLSDNFDTFLSLLTAQLQNQDPLSPMDSTHF
ncbi:MAG: flagellar hook capping FlgD N-terminal domain-containing protein, partial [Hyphomonadaceae bacterium]